MGKLASWQQAWSSDTVRVLRWTCGVRTRAHKVWNSILSVLHEKEAKEAVQRKAVLTTHSDLLTP